MSKLITYSLSDDCIEKLAAYIVDTHAQAGADFSRVAVVFGGRRPALFVKRALATHCGRDLFPPRFFSIDELITTIVAQKDPRPAIGDLDSCYVIYQLVKDHAVDIMRGRESFAQFLPWTKEILSFIDQLDLEDISDEALMRMSAQARIGYAVPDDVNLLLTRVVSVRHAYHAYLDAQGLYSRGLRYRRAADAVAEASLTHFDEIIFCNFFYLNRCEEKVIQHLFARGATTLMVQGDDRRWPVLKKMADHLGTTIREKEAVAPPGFDLKLYAGFDAHSEIGMVREILRTVDSLEKTVIVVPTAEHIVPLLSEITSVVETFNISMGYPLKRSSLYALCQQLFAAQLSRRDGRYYAKEYLAVMRHPFVREAALTPVSGVMRTLLQTIESALTGGMTTAVTGRLFIALDDILADEALVTSAQEALAHRGIAVSRDELRHALRQVHELAFTQWEWIATFREFAAHVAGFLDVIMEKSPAPQYPFTATIAAKMYALADEFSRAAFADERFTPEDLFRIFEGKIAGEIVAFSGSPLKGLQLLGLFETRSLSFDTVIVLDANEGTLPRLNVYEPFIPREVMISLGLDRLELEEEIQRYHFMRLISSAKQVHLVYQERKDKERSRFIEELVWEQQKRCGSCQDVAVTRGRFSCTVEPATRVAKKTPAIIALLREHTFSATSINLYLRDPLAFYYQYVLGVREQEDRLDEPDARQVGSFVHGLLESAFTRFVGTKPVIDAGFRKDFVALFEEQFALRFGTAMGSDAFLLKAVVRERLERFLEKEATSEERQVSEVICLEKRFIETIPLAVGKIRFGYVVDRIDRMADGTIMILDYKTGSVDVLPKKGSLPDGAALSREVVRDHVRSFQLPLYFHYFDSQYPQVPLNAALYNLRTLKVQPFLSSEELNDRRAIDAFYLRLLNWVVGEILDPAVDFVEDRSHARRG